MKHVVSYFAFNCRISYDVNIIINRKFWFLLSSGVSWRTTRHPKSFSFETLRDLRCVAPSTSSLQWRHHLIGCRICGLEARYRLSICKDCIHVSVTSSIEGIVLQRDELPPSGKNPPLSGIPKWRTDFSGEERRTGDTLRPAGRTRHPNQSHQLPPALLPSNVWTGDELFLLRSMRQSKCDIQSDF